MKEGKRLAGRKARQVSQKHMHFLPAFFCLFSFLKQTPHFLPPDLHTFPFTHAHLTSNNFCTFDPSFPDVSPCFFPAHTPTSQHAQSLPLPHVPPSPPLNLLQPPSPSRSLVAQRSAQIVPRQQRRHDKLAQEVAAALRAREGVQRLELALHVLVGLCVCVGVVCVGCVGVRICFE